MKALVFLSAVIVTVTAPRLVALTIPSYEYDDLLARSDLVVVAEPLHNTRDTVERSTLRDVTPPTPVIGVETQFQAAWVIKGARQNRFTLHHYREPRRTATKVTVVIGILPLIKFKADKHVDYLLFLVREPDG